MVLGNEVTPSNEATNHSTVQVPAWGLPLPFSDASAWPLPTVKKNHMPKKTRELRKDRNMVLVLSLLLPSGCISVPSRTEGEDLLSDL